METEGGKEAPEGRWREAAYENRQERGHQERDEPEVWPKAEAQVCKRRNIPSSVFSWS